MDLEYNCLKCQGWIGGYGHRLAREIKELISNGRINEFPAQAQDDLTDWYLTKQKVNGEIKRFTGLPKSLLKLKGRFIMDYILDVIEKFNMPLIAYVNSGQEWLMSEVIQARDLEHTLVGKKFGHKWGDVKKDLIEEGELFIFHGDVLYSEGLIRRILDKKGSANVVTSVSSFGPEVTINNQGLLTSVNDGFWDFFHGQGYYNNNPNNDGFRFTDAIDLFCKENPDTCNEYGEDAVYPFAINNGLKIKVLAHKADELININNINDYLLAYDSV